MRYQCLRNTGECFQAIGPESRSGPPLRRGKRAGALTRRHTFTGPALTGLTGLDQLLRVLPHGLAVLLEFEATRLLPVW